MHPTVTFLARLAISCAALTPGARATAVPMHEPPLLSSVPAGPEGDLIRLGHKLVTDSAEASPEFAQNGLKCSSCHLDEGRQPWSAPLWAAWAARATEGSFPEVVDACYTSAMGAKKGPGPTSRETVAISAYSRFLAGGLKEGVSHEGRRLKMIPGIKEGTFDSPRADEKRGEAVFVKECVACHGADGAGNDAAPPLWGSRSYTSSSTMVMICCSSAFIKSFMPKGKADLSDQDALDVAAYVASQPRPAKGGDAKGDQDIAAMVKYYTRLAKKFIKQQLYSVQKNYPSLFQVLVNFFGVSPF
ncbi:MAG: c-type cytochrome [Betaproteobacteria bacterium]|nr:c-type cytochrome [Betaproteobacteria bacterium]